MVSKSRRQLRAVQQWHGWHAHQPPRVDFFIVGYALWTCGAQRLLVWTRCQLCAAPRNAHFQRDWRQLLRHAAVDVVGRRDPSVLCDRRWLLALPNALRLCARRYATLESLQQQLAAKNR